MRKTAAQAYNQNREAALVLLRRLEATLRAPAIAEDASADWGHVGTMAHVATKLQELSDFIHHEGEHAPESDGTWCETWSRDGSRKVRTWIPAR